MPTMTKTDDVAPDVWDVDPNPPRNRFGARPKLSPEAEAVRTAYVTAMRLYHGRRPPNGLPPYDSHPRWDGGTDPQTGRRHTSPVWPRIAAEAAKHGVSGVLLTAFLFKNWVGADRAPTPFDVAAERNVTAYLKHLFTSRAHIAERLRTEYAVFTSAVWAETQTTPDKTVAERFALNDTGRMLSPLFRYCVAAIRDYADVAARWLDAARQQLAAHPAAYLESWSTIIPPALKSEAAASIAS